MSDQWPDLKQIFLSMHGIIFEHAFHFQEQHKVYYDGEHFYLEAKAPNSVLVSDYDGDDLDLNSFREHCESKYDKFVEETSNDI